MSEVADAHRETQRVSNDYVTEVEARIGRIKEIQHQLQQLNTKHDLNCQLNDHHLAFLLSIDSGQLRCFLCDDADPEVAEEATFCGLGNVEPFLRACMGDGSQDSLLNTPLSENRGNDQAQREAQREALEGKECNDNPNKAAKKRNGEMCVLTEVALPDGAHLHLIPHTITKSPTDFVNARLALTDVLPAIEPDLFVDARRYLFPTNDDGKPLLSASEQTWNIISLAPDAHRYFDRAFFGLKVVDMPAIKVDDNDILEICVEFHWLPAQLAHSLVSKFKDLDTQALAEYLTELHNPWGDRAELGPGQPCLYLPSGRRIESGMRFYIPVLVADEPKTRFALKLMWLALRIAAISGAANIKDQLRYRHDDDWYTLTMKLVLEKWDRSQRRRRGNQSGR